MILSDSESSTSLSPRPPAIPAGWDFSVTFDGGNKSCGDLILDLKLFFQGLPSGTRVLVIATDPGAWIDIPAWCRVTGHIYIDESPPYYLIERR